tara:strand:- start:51 stop:1136 length:1086 start_codon:yes stop_codon:yes gene_type:complete
MVVHKCYFCDYFTKQPTNLLNHIRKKKKCSYLIRDLEINDMKTYNKYVELHKKEPNSDIWGLDYQNLPKPDYYSSDDEETNIVYSNFMKNYVENKSFYCEYCNKCFNRKDSLKRHYNSCKKKKNINNINNINNSNNSNSSLEDKISSLVQEKINELVKINELEKYKYSKIGTVNINIDNSVDNSVDNSITNIDNSITNSISLNNYGEENKEIFLDEKYILKWFKQPFSAIPDIVKKIHFTPNKRPENTNIRINNISNGKAQIYKNEWKTKMKKQIIKDLIKNLGEDLIEKYEDLIEEGKIKKKDYSDFHKFRAKFQSYYHDEDETFDEINQELSFMKDQEQQVDCILTDCCIKHKDYLKSL